MTKHEREYGFVSATDFNPSPDPVMEMLACIGRYPVRLRDLALDLFGAGAKSEALYPLFDRAKAQGFDLVTSNAKGGRVVECVKRHADMHSDCQSYWRQRSELVTA